MLFKLQPWSGNERLYFYRQSQQLAGQTGQIGKLRADFDRDGNGFFSTWEDIRDHLKTEEFKQTFDKAMETGKITVTVTVKEFFDLIDEIEDELCDSYDDGFDEGYDAGYADGYLTAKKELKKETERNGKNA